MAHKWPCFTIKIADGYLEACLLAADLGSSGQEARGELTAKKVEKA
jgi:hypothetical protein